MVDKIGFIGFGNMAKGICKGLISSGSIRSENINVCSKNYNKLKISAKEFSVNPKESLKEVIETSEILILAVKPYQVNEIKDEIIKYGKNKVLISIMAGFTFEKLREIFNNIEIINTLPNIQIESGKGILIVENNHNLSEKSYKKFKDLFSNISLICEVPISEYQIAGVISGCAPAFVTMFIEALSDAGVKYGLSRETSYTIAGNMIEGIAAYFNENNIHPGIIKDKICSPKGITIKGVNSLEQNSFKGKVLEAIDVIMGE